MVPDQMSKECARYEPVALWFVPLITRAGNDFSSRAGALVAALMPLSKRRDLYKCAD